MNRGFGWCPRGRRGRPNARDDSVFYWNGHVSRVGRWNAKQHWDFAVVRILLRSPRRFSTDQNLPRNGFKGDPCSRRWTGSWESSGHRSRTSCVWSPPVCTMRLWYFWRRIARTRIGPVIARLPLSGLHTWQSNTPKHGKVIEWKEDRNRPGNAGRCGLRSVVFGRPASF